MVYGLFLSFFYLENLKFVILVHMVSEEGMKTDLSKITPVKE